MFAESTKTLNPKPVSLFALVFVLFVGLFLFVFWWRRRRGKGCARVLDLVLWFLFSFFD